MGKRGLSLLIRSLTYVGETRLRPPRSFPYSMYLTVPDEQMKRTGVLDFSHGVVRHILPPHPATNVIVGA